MPTFSRHPGTGSDDERPTASTTPVRGRTDGPVDDGRDDTVAGPPMVSGAAPASRMRDDRVRDDRDAANRDANVAPPPRRIEPTTIGDGRPQDRTLEDRTVDDRAVGDVPVRDDKKPRASLLATLGLILSVVAAMLVLSGPLLGYGIGVAVLALILSLSGISATGKRHIAGKTDALIGMVLSLAAVVVGVLALTGSLSWLGTDMQPVTSLREWLDTQFANRF